MNVKRKILSFLFFISFSAGAENLTLAFQNGDELSGSNLSYSLKEDTLEFEALFIKRPIVVSPTVIDYLNMGLTDLAVSQEGSSAEIEFTNGDILRGKVQNISADYLNVLSHWGELLELKKSMISEIKFFKFGKEIKRGFGSLSEWTAVQNTDDIKLEKEEMLFVERSGTSQQIPFHSRAHYTFEIDWENRPQAHFYFNGTYGGIHNPGTFLQLNLQRNRIEGRLSTEDSKQMFGQKDGLSKLMAQKSIKLDVYIDLSNLKFIVAVDNQTLATWDLPEEARELKGEWFYLFSDSSQQQTFSNFAIYKWNGVVSLAREGDEELLKEEESPLLELQNGDLVSGEITDIREGKVAVLDQYGDPYEVALDRVKSLKLNNQLYEEPRRYAGDCSIRLGGRSKLTLKVLEIKEQAIVGFSQVYGEVTIPVAACSEISFNLYE